MWAPSRTKTLPPSLTWLMFKLNNVLQLTSLLPPRSAHLASVMHLHLFVWSENLDMSPLETAFLSLALHLTILYHYMTFLYINPGLYAQCPSEMYCTIQFPIGITSFSHEEMCLLVTKSELPTEQSQNSLAISRWEFSFWYLENR